MNLYLPIPQCSGDRRLCLSRSGSVALAQITGPSRYNRAKLEAYECGIEPSDQPANAPHAGSGQRFPVKYYLTAMLFIVFDIEIVFYSTPWAVASTNLGVIRAGRDGVRAHSFRGYASAWRRRGDLTWD